MIGLIIKEDLTNVKHDVVKKLFDVISLSNFDSFISTVCSDIGWGEEFCSCNFPGDLDEDEKESIGYFDGLLFVNYFDEEFLLSYEEFYYYIKKATDRYIQLYPEKAEYISGEVKKYREKHNCE